MRKPPTIDHEAVARFPLRWINRAEALRLIGRSKVTLWKWEKAGAVRRKNRGGEHVFEAGELLRARDEYAARLKRSQGTPNPARAEIARMIEAGVARQQIVEQLGCTKSLVNYVRRQMKAATS